ncbi:MAG: hypothetical protein VKP62_09390 [Candidatus Sericytochromatia bacterium]|nr:hypothetical protein [Candidatus Sericytochromatia bacterium]
MRHGGLLIFSVAALTACRVTVTPPETSESKLGAARPRAAAARVQYVPVRGTVRIPSGLAVGAGVKLVSDRGLGLISDRGISLISPAGFQGARTTYRLLALDTVAVEGARVILTDAAGQSLPEVAPVRTDAGGEFSLPRVPAGLSFVVAAEVPTFGGAAATFRSLIRTTKPEIQTRLDPATTLVTSNLVEELGGKPLGDFDPARFQEASESTAQSLVATKLPDFTDATAVSRAMKALLNEVATLRSQVTMLEAALAKALPDPLPKATGERDESGEAKEVERSQAEVRDPGSASKASGNVNPPPQGAGKASGHADAGSSDAGKAGGVTGTGHSNIDRASDSGHTGSSDANKGSGNANASSGSDNTGSSDANKGSGNAPTSSGSIHTGSSDASKGSGNANASSGSDNTGSSDANKGSGNSNAGSGTGSPAPSGACGPETRKTFTVNATGIEEVSVHRADNGAKLDERDVERRGGLLQVELKVIEGCALIFKAKDKDDRELGSVQHLLQPGSQTLPSLF